MATLFSRSLNDSGLAKLECCHRQRACAEQTIRDAKACDLANLPLDDVVNNDLWCRLVSIAVNLFATIRVKASGPEAC